ncbi:MAG TPA: DUF599 family protein [Thauera sp.]|nr:DUF599 family protein [Thauera sp.]
MKIFALLPWSDWLALAAFLASWVGYGRFSRELGKRRTSLASTTDRATEMMKAAAESFYDGLRAYYFSFAAMAWFLSPLAMVLASFVVVAVLYGREFHGDVSKILGEDKKPLA